MSRPTVSPTQQRGSIGKPDVAEALAGLETHRRRVADAMAYLERLQQTTESLLSLWNANGLTIPREGGEVDADMRSDAEHAIEVLEGYVEYSRLVRSQEYSYRAEVLTTAASEPRPVTPVESPFEKKPAEIKSIWTAWLVVLRDLLSFTPVFASAKARYIRSGINHWRKEHADALDELERHRAVLKRYVTALEDAEMMSEVTDTLLKVNKYAGIALEAGRKLFKEGAKLTVVAFENYRKELWGEVKKEVGCDRDELIKKGIESLGKKLAHDVVYSELYRGPADLLNRLDRTDSRLQTAELNLSEALKELAQHESDCQTQLLRAIVADLANETPAF